MISIRTVSSLAQMLALLPTQTGVVLLAKYGMYVNVEYGRELFDYLNALRDHIAKPVCLDILDEVIRTNSDLSNQVTPRYRFKERYTDLCHCLELDGFRVEERKLTPIDPSIADTPDQEDELLERLKASDLESKNDIRTRLTASTEAFRRTPPDYNACLTNARVALESIAKAVAECNYPGEQARYDPKKWGSVISFLRAKEFFSKEEELGLAGVYSFLSPGAHRPIGLTESEASRLGRSLALSMSWYLLKRHQSVGSDA